MSKEPPNAMSFLLSCSKHSIFRARLGYKYIVAGKWLDAANTYAAIRRDRSATYEDAIDARALEDFCIELALKCGEKAS